MEKFSFLNAVHPSYIADLYDRYLQNPDLTEPGWRSFFQGYDFALENYGFDDKKTEPLSVVVPESLKREFQVVKLIDAYRTRGHLFTKTNPVRKRRKYLPTLDVENFGLSESDMDTVFNAGEILGIGAATLRKIIRHLKQIYCESIGVEYMYIRNPNEINWIQNKLNINNNHTIFSADEKKLLLTKLNEAVSFETFLHTKFTGQKRFSIEGGETLIPALDALVEYAADLGVEEFVMGMAHRGRLNVLSNIFGKSPEDIFSEFEGKEYEEEVFDGDVKYHLGWSTERHTRNGKKITMNLAPNPSHLEAVNPVVEGIARAKLKNKYGCDESKVLPILIHGDAAVAAQGIVYEVVQMSKLEGYRTGGTIHIVVNNQIGFTTNYLDARSSTYCTDVAKITLSPVFHVNADDAEAVVHTVLLALDFRMKFNRDVFIDLLGYRKYGHNEGDEPRFTQPKLYKAIAKHANAGDIYAAKLVEEGVIDTTYVSQLRASFKEQLEKEFDRSVKKKISYIFPFMQEEWKGFVHADTERILSPSKTTCDIERLKHIGRTISTLPKGKKFLRKIERLIEDRRKMIFETDKLNWAMGELLAYGSLLDEGFCVRVSGQDVERGTFSHRHAILKVEESEEEINLLNHISDTQGRMSIYNSPLSEYGVLGFDYGYAMASPGTLTIWEAQFGDFSNGAQIIFDQYISSAEDKWKVQNGIVLLLPHGYEGQGAEHSSARMERYLQQCADDNIIVANCTTPAQLFHLLRRQMKQNYKKPLIIFTPKSLLRHPKVVSSLEELARGTFQEVIDDTSVNTDDVKTLVFCSGKFYYDLLNEREQNGRKDVALVRLEQLYPLAETKLQTVIANYPNVDDYVWAQEEPENMGAWTYITQNFNAVPLRVCSRKRNAATASGSIVRYKQRHQKVIESVFDKSLI